jgi:hypothetical protein
LFISLSKKDNTIVVIPAMTQSLVMGYLFQIVYHIFSKYFFQKPIPSESNQVFALQRASITFDGSDKIRQKNNGISVLVGLRRRDGLPPIREESRAATRG